MSNAPKQEFPAGSVRKEVTPFGVIRIYPSGTDLAEMDAETKQTLGRILEDQRLHPERYDQPESPADVMARVAAARTR